MKIICLYCTLMICIIGVYGGRDVLQTSSTQDEFDFFPGFGPFPGFPPFEFPDFPDFLDFEFPDFPNKFPRFSSPSPSLTPLPSSTPSPDPFPWFSPIYSYPSPSPSPNPFPSPSPSPTPEPSPYFYPSPSLVSDSVVEEFNQNKALWQTSNIIYYRYTIRRSCFCVNTDPVDITVCNGVSTETEFYQALNTIDKVIAFLESEIQKPLASLTVTYDPIYGFPEYFFIDEAEQLADEEFGYSITNFFVLTEGTCTV